MYRNLGSTGIQISAIGFGCMSLGKNSEKDSIDLIHRAIDEGINFFDTADIYDAGGNEELLGKVLKDRRQKVVLATKVGNVIKPGGGKGFDWNPSKEHILKSIEGSLKRLQTDHVDLYQLHGGTIEDNIDESIEAFEILKQQGKILHYGISSIRPNVIREYVKRSNIVSVMMQYSILDRRPEEEMLGLLKQNDISVMARGALAQGLLIDKPGKEYLKHSAGEVNAARTLLTDNTGAVENNAAGAIDFVLGNDAITSAVVGFRTKEQLEATLNPVFSLSKSSLETIRSSISAYQYSEHR